jgi:hypothetical protein
MVSYQASGNATTPTHRDEDLHRDQTKKARPAR